VTVDTTGPDSEADVAGVIARSIRRRTDGRVRDVRVEVADGVVTVRGSAPSYYLKQLALEAARAGLTGSHRTLLLEITVHAR
jgi:hypothetical protein